MTLRVDVTVVSFQKTGANPQDYTLLQVVGAGLIAVKAGKAKKTSPRKVWHAKEEEMEVDYSQDLGLIFIFSKTLSAENSIESYSLEDRNHTVRFEFRIPLSDHTTSFFIPSSTVIRREPR